MTITIKRLSITATAKSPVRVGGSRDPVRGVDLPMATVAGRPVIPGTSLKGALRAQIEQHLLGLSINNESLKPCIPVSRPSKAEELLKGYRKGGACSAQVEDTGDEVKPATDNICPACYLLGAQGLEGFIRVPFLTASISQEELVGVAIDRGTGTIRGGAVWEYEFVPTNTIFIGILEIILLYPGRGWEFGKPRPGFEKEDSWLAKCEWSPEKIEKELVNERLEAIKTLGGFKSKGFGKVSITVTPCEN